MPYLVAVPILIALVVVTELFFRARNRRLGYFVLQAYSRLRLKLDREILPDLEPEVRIHVNADGERGGPSPGTDVYRVLVVGGSAAECYLLDQDSQWPSVIERRLNEPSSLAALGETRVHVGNISRSLVNCDYLTMIMGKVLDRFARLDTVITFVGASDVVAWLEAGTPATIDKPVHSMDYAFNDHPQATFGWSPKRTATWRQVGRVQRKLMRPEDVRENVGRRIGKNRTMRAAATTLIDEVPDPAPMVAYFEEHFRRMIQAAQGRAKRVLVVRQPWFEKEFTAEENARLWNFGKGRPYERELDTYYTHRVVAALMRAVDEAGSRVARDMGVEQLDLMPVLERSFDTYYDFLHFTPKGAEGVGNAVASAILRETPKQADGADRS